MHGHDQSRRVGAVLFSIGHVLQREYIGPYNPETHVYKQKYTGAYNPEACASPAVGTCDVHLPNTGSGGICTDSFCCEAIYQHKIYDNSNYSTRLLSVWEPPGLPRR